MNEDEIFVFVIPGNSYLQADSLTFSASSDTSAVSVSISADTLSVNPSSNWFGSTSISLIIESLNGTTNTGLLNLTVNPVNDSPDDF